MRIVRKKGYENKRDSWKSRKKKVQLLASLALLSRCRKQEVIPKIIIKSTHARRFYNHMEWIQNSRSNLTNIYLKLISIFCHLSSSPHPTNWNKMDSISFRKNKIWKMSQTMGRQCQLTAKIVITPATEF